MNDIILKEYLLSVYFGFWMYLCLLPLVRFCSGFLKNIRIDIRSFAPYSYAIVGNHYDFDDCDDYASPSVPMQNNPIIQVPFEWTTATSGICKANEYWHVVCDQSGHYHIGLIIEIVDIDDEVVLCTDVLVPVAAFYRFPIEAAKQYLLDLADLAEEFPSVVLADEIGHNIHVEGLLDLPFPQRDEGLGQVDEIEYGGAKMVIKTYWICIVQRRWKRVYAEKMRKARLRGGLRAQHNFEISGKYGIDVGFGRGLRGLICRESANIIVD
jgi:hypothetical protein